MFEMYKYVLDKVSFDQLLFRKELEKAMKKIKPNEQLLFKMWCLNTFDQNHKDILNEVFDGEYSFMPLINNSIHAAPFQNQLNSETCSK